MPTDEEYRQRGLTPPVVSNPIYDTVPISSPISPAASALVGFAKGLSESMQKREEINAGNQRVAMQYLISKGMVNPAFDGRSDFQALGMPWRVNPYGSTVDQNEQSLIQDRAFEQEKAQATILPKILEESKQYEKVLRDQYKAELEYAGFSGSKSTRSREQIEKEIEDKVSEYEDALIETNRASRGKFYNASMFEKQLEALENYRKARKRAKGLGTESGDKTRDELEKALSR